MIRIDEILNFIVRIITSAAPKMISHSQNGLHCATHQHRLLLCAAVERQRLPTA
jgi:hypothetical protein